MLMAIKVLIILKYLIVIDLLEQFNAINNQDGPGIFNFSLINLIQLINFIKRYLKKLLKTKLRFFLLLYTLETFFLQPVFRLKVIY